MLYFMFVEHFKNRINMRSHVKMQRYITKLLLIASRLCQCFLILKIKKGEVHIYIPHSTKINTQMLSLVLRVFLLNIVHPDIIVKSTCMPK